MPRNPSASSGVRSGVAARKAKALERGARVALFAPASPGSEAKVTSGVAELKRLGFAVELPAGQRPEGYFAAAAEGRRAEVGGLICDPRVDGLIGLCGGYGCNYFLRGRLAAARGRMKILLRVSVLSPRQTFFCHGS